MLLRQGYTPCCPGQQRRHGTCVGQSTRQAPRPSRNCQPGTSPRSRGAPHPGPYSLVLKPGTCELGRLAPTRGSKR